MLKQYQRYLRRNLTPAERLFWSKIRSRQINNLKFRRQHIIGKYIVDFYCAGVKLVIEIDGDTHDGSPAIDSDLRRTRFLESLGYRVIRYNNSNVLKNIDGVIQDLINQNQPPLNLLLEGGGETEK